MEAYLSFDINLFESFELVDCNFVYDIEVEDNHNFFLENDVLVHNSGKTHHIILKLLLASFSKEYQHIVYVNKEFSNIKKAQYKDFKKVAKFYDLDKYFRFYNNDYSIVNNVTGWTFTAIGMDDPEKTKGVSDPTIIWWDELTKGTYEDFLFLNALLRTPLNPNHQFIGSWNPISETHWLRKNFFDENNAYKLKDSIKDAYLNHSTYLNNDFIDKEKYKETLILNANGSEYRLNVDLKGLWGNIIVDNLFIYAYDSVKHTPPEPIPIIQGKPVYISVDFNVNPMTAIVAQFDVHFRYIHIVDEFRLKESDVYELSDKIKLKYNSMDIIMTGDASGWSRNVNTRGHKSSFEILKQELKLNWTQVKTPKGKWSGYVTDKRHLANGLLTRHPNFKISSNCPFLIEDITSTKIDNNGKMDKKTDSQKSHLLDAFCDLLITLCRNATKNI
jgi:PBSX family phage terminase large subunit